MNPQELFCPNMDCAARGQVGKGNIHTHSLKDKRCICDVCKQTFTTTRGTVFYRLRSDPQLVMWVIILLAYGCPVQVAPWRHQSLWFGRAHGMRLEETSRQTLSTGA
jgi:hypothetical protein